jgi:hypothetical protein
MRLGLRWYWRRRPSPGEMPPPSNRTGFRPDAATTARGPRLSRQSNRSRGLRDWSVRRAILIGTLSRAYHVVLQRNNGEPNLNLTLLSANTVGCNSFHTSSVLTYCPKRRIRQVRLSIALSRSSSPIAASVTEQKLGRVPSITPSYKSPPTTRCRISFAATRPNPPVLEQRECLQVDAERLAEFLGVVGMGGLPGVSAINCRVAESTVCLDRLPGSGVSGVAVGRASRV